MNNREEKQRTDSFPRMISLSAPSLLASQLVPSLGIFGFFSGNFCTYNRSHRARQREKGREGEGKEGGESNRRRERDREIGCSPCKLFSLIPTLWPVMTPAQTDYPHQSHTRGTRGDMNRNNHRGHSNQRKLFCNIHNTHLP